MFSFILPSSQSLFPSGPSSSFFLFSSGLHHSLLTSFLPSTIISFYYCSFPLTLSFFPLITPFTNDLHLLIIHPFFVFVPLPSSRHPIILPSFRLFSSNLSHFTPIPPSCTHTLTAVCLYECVSLGCAEGRANICLCSDPSQPGLLPP